MKWMKWGAGSDSLPSINARPSNAAGVYIHMYLQTLLSKVMYNRERGVGLSPEQFRVPSLALGASSDDLLLSGTESSPAEPHTSGVTEQALLLFFSAALRVTHNKSHYPIRKL